MQQLNVAPVAYSSAVPQAQNPYAAGAAISKGQQMGGGGAAVQAFRPLYEATFFINFLAWFFIITGVLYCITIVFIVVGWLPLWIGICLKNAGSSLKQGYPTGNIQLLHKASTNLATIAKIVGVLYMIMLVLFALYILVIIVAIGAGAFGAASGGF